MFSCLVAFKFLLPPDRDPLQHQTNTSIFFSTLNIVTNTKKLLSEITDLFISYNQGSGLTAFAYFNVLTYNLAECYVSVCHVTTCSIIKYESDYF